MSPRLKLTLTVKPQLGFIPDLLTIRRLSLSELSTSAKILVTYLFSVNLTLRTTSCKAMTELLPDHTFIPTVPHTFSLKSIHELSWLNLSLFMLGFPLLLFLQCHIADMTGNLFLNHFLVWSIIECGDLRVGWRLCSGLPFTRA